MLRIDLVFDVVCPWCFVGKRQLDAALADLGLRDRAELAWHPYLLDPDVPEEDGGPPLADYLAAKYGAGRLIGMWQRLRAVGAELGLSFAFERMRRQSSVEAHRLIRHAARQGRGEAVVERLFRAYFEEAGDIASAPALAALAAEAGLPEAETRAWLESGEERDAVLAEAAGWQRAGVTGVPFTILDRRLAIPGAVGRDAMKQMLAEQLGAGAGATAPAGAPDAAPAA